MTPAAFIAWRKRLGFTVAAAAEALGMSPSQINDYERGIKRGRGTPAPIPRVVALACAWVEHTTQNAPDREGRGRAFAKG